MFFHRLRTKLAAERHLLGYASGNFGKAILLGSVDVTLLFLLTDIAGIAPARVSLLMLAVLAGDLVFDLGAGVLAARAERRGIGYRCLVALAALPCALAFCAVYSLPLLCVDSPALFATLLLFMRCCFALVDVPHNSLLARVSQDSRARGRVSGYRTMFSSAAAMLVAYTIAPLVQGAGGAAAARRMACIGVLGGLLFCASLLFSAWSSKPLAAPPPQGARARLFPAPDRLFGAMAAIALLTGFAMPMFTKMLLYLCTYVLHDPAFAGRVLSVLALSQVAGAVFWTALVRRHDKTTLLACSHGLAIVGLALFAAAGTHQAALLASTLAIGAGSAGVFMLPWGILADVVDFSEFRRGARHETAWFAAMLVLLKGGGAAALATVGWVLGMLGYVPGAQQAPAVLLGMKLLGIGVPVAGSLLAILVLRRMRLGHALHARVGRANRRRRLSIPG